MRIFISFTNWENKELLEPLKQRAEIVIAEKMSTQAEFQNIVSDFDGVIIGRIHIINREVLEHSRLKFVGIIGKGVNNIDVEECEKHHVAVLYTPEANIESTAEHTMTLLLALSKNLVQLDKSVRDERFDLYRHSTIEIKDKVLGVIGAGAIAKQVIVRARAFGMKILCHTQHPENHQDLGVSFVALTELLKHADFVSINIPLTHETRNLIDEKELLLMKKSSFLINTARGGIVNENALTHVLKNHLIAGAGIDVFEEEPTHKKDFFVLDNIILTPHVAGISHEGLYRMEQHIVNDVIAFVENKPPKYRLV